MGSWISWVFFFQKVPCLVWLSLPGYVTARAHRGSPGLPPCDRELNSRYGVARPPERLALCSFFFPSFRRAATVGGGVKAGAQPHPSAAEGAGLDAREPPRRILRSLPRRGRKAVEGQSQAEQPALRGAGAPLGEEAQGGVRRRHGPGRVASTRTARSAASGKAPLGMGGRRRWSRHLCGA